MKRFNTIAACILSIASAYPQSWDTHSDTWVAVDALGRELPNSDMSGISTDVDENCKIGIFYYLWQNMHPNSNKDISVLLKDNPDNPDFGNEGLFHWWGKPVLGYYTAGDEYVIAKHMQMIADAGIDFLFFDCTNELIYPEIVRKIMVELDRRESLDLKPIKICFMIHTSPQETAELLYNTFYKYPEYDKYWFKYEGKPLLLGDVNEIKKTKIPGLVDCFTFRFSWAWLKGERPNEWAWLEFYPQVPGWTGSSANKKIEQISVSTAQHPTSKIGKSYHNGRQPSLNRYAVCEDTPNGLYFQEQWDEAIKQHPPIVMITQFNEWMAQRYIVKNNSELHNTRPGGTSKVGESYFVDAYNEEFNRDIEPSWNELIRDNYYMQMCANIRKFKGINKMPSPDNPLSIDISGDMQQWDNIFVEYRDDKGDILNSSQPDVQSEGVTSRKTNDIIMAKVSSDEKNLYFHVETDKNISNYAFSKLWMKLMLNTDTNYKTGWNGYDYMVCKDPNTRKYSLMRNAFGAYKWQNIGEVSYRIDGNRMHLAIPKKDLKISGNVDIDFKWADNTSDDNPDILSFITDGDVAPNGRFNYRYRGSEISNGGVMINKESTQFIKAFKIDSGTMGLHINLPEPARVSINVYDMQGMLVDRKQITNSQAGLQEVNINLGRGLYIIETIVGNRHDVIRFKM